MPVARSKDGDQDRVQLSLFQPLKCLQTLSEQAERQGATSWSGAPPDSRYSRYGWCRSGAGRCLASRLLRPGRGTISVRAQQLLEAPTHTLGSRQLAAKLWARVPFLDGATCLEKPRRTQVLIPYRHAEMAPDARLADSSAASSTRSPPRPKWCRMQPDGAASGYYVADLPNVSFGRDIGTTCRSGESRPASSAGGECHERQVAEPDQIEMGHALVLTGMLNCRKRARGGPAGRCSVLQHRYPVGVGASSPRRIDGDFLGGPDNLHSN